MRAVRKKAKASMLNAVLVVWTLKVFRSGPELRMQVQPLSAVRQEVQMKKRSKNNIGKPNIICWSRNRLLASIKVYRTYFSG